MNVVPGQPQPASDQLQPAEIHQPQPTGIYQTQPAGMHKPPPTSEQPQPAGVHQMMSVDNRNPSVITDDGMLIKYNIII